MRGLLAAWLGLIPTCLESYCRSFYLVKKMVSKKRKRNSENPTIHPRNKYSENPPDFTKLASLYPTFEQYVFYSQTGRPRIDWTDFNATRELTRILLLHDHKLNWWIPDGQLCPTVPNRSNYIHWIEDLLSSDLVPKINNEDANVKGFDIGTGANCIYPLLGASLLGWSFVGSDVTDVALEWAEKNVKNNPHISELIEIRKAISCQETVLKEEVCGSENVLEVSRAGPEDTEPLPSTVDNDVVWGDNESYQVPPVLVGVVKDVEKYDFCMCNPPFFETMEEAGLNPKTACGGTPEEMVCYGGEKTFVTLIIEDSIVLKQSFRWFTSMVGRKYNLKYLVAKLWEVGATIVKTTEFVQGQTSRWGLAWSFMSHARQKIAPPVVSPSVLSFTIQGVNRQFNAIHVLKHIESFFRSSGASVKINTSSFTVDITVSNDHVNAVLINKELVFNVSPGSQYAQETSSGSTTLAPCSNSLCFRVSIFQQVPGTLLVKGNLQKKDSQISGTFSLIFQLLEEELKCQFGKK